MSLYQCEQCGCVENTAVGFYHGSDMDIYPPEVRGKKLCSVCGPTHFASGEPILRYNEGPAFGQWHGKFNRVFFTLGSLYTNENGNVARKRDGVEVRLNFTDGHPTQAEANLDI